MNLSDDALRELATKNTTGGLFSRRLLAQGVLRLLAEKEELRGLWNHCTVAQQQVAREKWEDAKARLAKLAARKAGGACET